MSDALILICPSCEAVRQSGMGRCENCETEESPKHYVSVETLKMPPTEEMTYAARYALVNRHENIAAPVFVAMMNAFLTSKGMP